MSMVAGPTDDAAKMSIAIACRRGRASLPRRMPNATTSLAVSQTVVARHAGSRIHRSELPLQDASSAPTGTIATTGPPPGPATTLAAAGSRATTRRDGPR